MPDVAMPDLEDLHKCPMGTGSQVSRSFFHAAPTTFAAMSCSRSLPGDALLPWKACKHLLTCLIPSGSQKLDLLTCWLPWPSHLTWQG